MSSFLHYRLGVENKKFSSLPLKTLNELKPLAKTLYNLKLNNNGFQSLPVLLQGNKTFDKLRSLDISHNPISGKKIFVIELIMPISIKIISFKITTNFKR